MKNDCRTCGHGKEVSSVEIICKYPKGKLPSSYRPFSPPWLGIDGDGDVCHSYDGSPVSFPCPTWIPKARAKIGGEA
jgi:hypothetical protein